MSVNLNTILIIAHLCVLCFGYEYSNRTGHCYKFHARGSTWVNAYTTCVAEGALLAVPNSKDEKMVLLELFERFPDTAILGATNDGAMYVGIYWESGAWRTVDGQILVHSGLMPNNGPESEEFGYAFMYRHGKLDNLFSTLKRPFICEMVPAAPRNCTSVSQH